MKEFTGKILCIPANSQTTVKVNYADDHYNNDVYNGHYDYVEVISMTIKKIFMLNAVEMYL